MSDMKPFRDLITFDEAKSIIMESTRPVEGTEEVSLLEAAGRVLAADVVAGRSVPGFRRAGMDGYAVRAEDTFGATRAKPVELALKGKVFAGQTPSGEVVAGTCIQAATGAPMPGGSDAVVMVEETSTEGDTIRVHKPVYPGAHVSEADADIGEGERVMSAGTVLTPPRTGVLAALGLDRVQVFRRPRVMVYPTGDEVVRPGGELTFGKVYDINSYTMATLLESLGAEVTLGDIGEDSLEGLTRCLRDAAGMDYILFSGGSSVGERDLLSTLAEKEGEVLFHGIALKPGKPTLCAKVGDALVFGMPGYPTSCLINAYVLLAPSLRKAARMEWSPRSVSATLGDRVVSTIGRHQIYTVRLEGDVAVPAFKESGAITSMSLADGYVEIPANTEFVEKGEAVRVVLF